MKRNENSQPAPGWVGGFPASNSAFTYPDPDLSSIEVTHNLDNIPKIQRQQAVYWPEFSWETDPGDPESRCFQRFAHDISRLGYDDTGRSWSIICPQVGHILGSVGALNVEVTVTGQRGWADEDTKEMAADMSVESRIWFTPSSHQNWFVREAWEHFAENELPFPFEKKDAIRVIAHAVGDPSQPLFPLRKGMSPRIDPPDFARHPEAWNVAHVSVQNGPIKHVGHPKVDAFNEHVLGLFNLASGNMLAQGNVLTWNVWFTAPELVDTQEWETHAERWRHSIDVDHGESPDGSVSSPARYADGRAFEPGDVLEDELKDFLRRLKRIL